MFLVVAIVLGLYFGGVFGGANQSDQAQQPQTQQQQQQQPAQQQAPPKVWKRSGETQAVGGPGGGAQTMVCKENTFVTEFSGGSGALIDRIGLKCSDGSSLGPFGGGGGAPFTVKNDSGFDKLVTRSGSLVDSIRVYGDGRELIKVGGDGGGGPTDLACNGGKIMGLNVRTGGLVDNIQVVCATQQ